MLKDRATNIDEIKANLKKLIILFINYNNLHCEIDKNMTLGKYNTNLLNDFKI